jgi:hypothetical protein
MRVTEDACHGYCFAQHHLGFFEAPELQKGINVVVGCQDIEFERYIAVRKPRPPTEPEGEDIEAMMRGVGLSDHHDDSPQPEGQIPPPGPASPGGPPGHI